MNNLLFVSSLRNKLPVVLNRHVLSNVNLWMLMALKPYNQLQYKESEGSSIRDGSYAETPTATKVGLNFLFSYTFQLLILLFQTFMGCIIHLTIWFLKILAAFAPSWRARSDIHSRHCKFWR